MSTQNTPVSAVAAGAREAARQDNGQFGTQARSEADVQLTTPGGFAILTDAYTGAQYVDRPDTEPLHKMNERLERARDHYYDHMAVYDLLETVENQWDDDPFDPEDAAYAVIFDDRDDDGDRCSNVRFYDAQGNELGEVAQAGYTINHAPAHFKADNAPGEAGQLGGVDMAKVKNYDWEKFGADYANQLRDAADEYDRNRAQAKYDAITGGTMMFGDPDHAKTSSGDTTGATRLNGPAAEDEAEEICPKCGSPADAPDPTCSTCPETERVACYAGNCTYIASDDADLDYHVANDCQYQDNSNEGRWS